MAGAFATLASAADDPAGSPFPAGYAPASALKEKLDQLAREHPDRVQLTPLARTGEGRDVWLVELAADVKRKDDPPLPAILVVANLEADHVVGSEVALRIIEHFAAAGPDSPALKVLTKARLFVVPRLNTDGAERLLADAPMPIRTNLRPIDRDRDGQTGEDGPDDLDGDRRITSLRVRDARASLVPDAKDPRILRKPDAAQGEMPVYSEYTEGRDDDGDGALNEDPAGGVNLNRNWPRKWPEFEREAGPTPLSEPETRALIRFAFEHPEIVAVWSFAPLDNLREEPKREGSGLEKDDLPIVVELSREYRKALDTIPKDAIPTGEAPRRDEIPALPETGPVPAPSSTLAGPGLSGTADGSIHEWAYHQLGVLGLSTRLWDGPDWAKPAEGQEAPPRDGEARWLFWNDRVMGGQAFVPLKVFEHPALGPVLLGGWRPGVRLNPPINQVAEIAQAHAAFLENLAGRVPSLAIPTARQRALGGGLFEITAIVENTGKLPTALEQGVRTRQARPVLVRLEAGGGKLIAGQPLARLDSLAPGQRREFRWTVAMPEAGGSVTIEAATAKAGRARASLDLK